ncbi:MAG: type II secretion system GspH family protein [Abditibacteriales bacterium]|nr:type II secretion system GspH family protein [Abditibacteriales bacterium]MDW8365812.1 type II secretion system protein [Abditibacteriales bacterium]
MKSQKSGFTLIELLVSIGIAVILFTLLFIPMRSALSSMSEGQAQHELQRNADYILAQMTRELSQAIRVFNNDAPRTTVVDEGAAIINNTAYPTLQVTSTVGFLPGDTVMLSPPVPPTAAVIWDISEPSHLPPPNPPYIFRTLGVAAPNDRLLLFQNLPKPNPTFVYAAGTDVVGPSPYLDGRAANPLTAPRVSLNSRLDFILPRGLTRGTVSLLPLTPETLTVGGVELPVVVTYYVRKRQPLDAAGQGCSPSNAQVPPCYDPLDNPLQLYRAQYVPRPGPGGILANGCWRIANQNFEVPYGITNTGSPCDPTAASPGAPMVLTPQGQLFYTHNALTPLTDVDVGGRCADGSDPTTNPDCLNGSELVTDTNFVVSREGGQTRVTITLVLGRYDRSRSQLQKVQLRTDVQVLNAHQNF